MKKILKVIIATMVAVAALVPAAAGAASPMVKVTVDGQAVKFPDAQPYVETSRVLIPVRFVSEALGARVDYKDRAVTVRQNEKLITLKIDSKNVSVSEKTVILDVPARAQESRVFVPLRFVSEALGATVHYQDRIVTITTGTGGVDTESVPVPDGNFKVDPKYHDLAPLVFKDNIRIEGDELVFTMPDLKGRTVGSYEPWGKSDTALTPGQEYRFKLGANAYVSIAYAHSDEHIEGYLIYLNPKHKALGGEFDSVVGDVIVVSANTTIPYSETTLKQVLHSFDNL